MKRLVGIFVFIYTCYGNLIPIHDEDNNDSCLETIINHDTNSSIHNLFITEGEFSLKLDLVFYKTDHLNLEQYLSNIKNKPQSYIIISQHIDLLNQTLNNIVNSDMFYDANYLIIIQDIEKTKQIAKILWSYRLLKSRIIVLSETRNSFKVYKILLKDCGEQVSTSLTFDSTITNSCAINERLYNIDTKSPFRRCPLYTIWTSLPPFVEQIDGEARGIFVDLLDSFGYISDRPVVFRPYDQVYIDEISWGFYYDTASEDMARGYAQIFVGITDILLSGLFDLSPVLSSDSMIVLMPIPLVDYWSIFFKLINYKMFAIYFGGLLMIAMVFYKHAQVTQDRNFDSFQEVILLLFGMSLSVCTFHKWPKNIFMRIFLGNMLLSSILVIFFTQGSIFSILSGSIYGKPITNVYEFIEADLPLRVVKGVDILLAGSWKRAEYNVMNQQYSILPNASSLIEAGDAVLKQRNFATISDMAFVLMRPNIQKAFTYFEVWNLRLCVIMRKYQYFYQEFYSWFITIVECGFYEKFQSLYQSGFALKNSVEPEKRTFVLTMHHLMPSFFFIGCGIVLSLFVFIMEIVYKTIDDKLNKYHP